MVKTTVPALAALRRAGHAADGASLLLQGPLRPEALVAGALNDNPFVLRPVNGGAPVQLKAAAVQSRAAAEFLAAEYRDGTGLRLGIQQLFEEVVWGEEERSDDAERAWQQLGLHLGLASTRPEKQYGTGPDNLWALSGGRQAVCELKTGCTTDTIAKKDMDQLGGSVRWLNDHNPEVEAVAVMVHPSRVCDDKAIAVPGMRVVTPALFEKLKKAVTAYAAALASSPDRWADEQAVREQLAHHKLTGDRFFATYSEPVRASSTPGSLEGPRLVRAAAYTGRQAQAGVPAGPYGGRRWPVGRSRHCSPCPPEPGGEARSSAYGEGRPVRGGS
ncbi:hypothetical protein [Streptomyces sp. NPDC047841]|uniref:hypothetical protein n=1 Tax=Streptomyces sp. NPDC047841 TaxID=3154708 RepID=UPI0034515E09